MYQVATLLTQPVGHEFGSQYFRFNNVYSWILNVIFKKLSRKKERERYKVGKEERER